MMFSVDKKIKEKCEFKNLLDLCVMFSCVFSIFPCDVLGQVWYLTVLIPDLCHLIYFVDMLLCTTVRTEIQ